MADDIVKNIILKFKGQTGDVKKIKKELESLEQAAGGSNRLRNMTKTYTQLQESLKKTGFTLDSTFQKINKNLRDLTERQVEGAIKKFEKMADVVEKRISKVKTLEESGASDDVLSRERRKRDTSISRAERASREAFQKHQEFREVSGGQRGGMVGMAQMAMQRRGIPAAGLGRGATMAGGAAAAVGGAGMAGARLSSLEMEIRQLKETARAGVAAPQIQAQRQMYGGDMSRAIMATQGAEQEAEEFSKQQTEAETRRRGFGILGRVGVGAAGGAAAGAAAGSIIPGVGTAIGAGVGMVGGAVMGAGRGAGQDYHFFAGGGREQFREQQRQEQLQRTRQRSVLPQLYDKFRQTAPERFEFGRQFQMSSENMMRFRQAARGFTGRTDPETGEPELDRIGWDPRRVAGAAQQMRQAGFGNVQSMTVAQGGGALARDFGQTFEGTQRFMQQAGMGGAGGVTNAKKQVEDVMSTAIASGVEDSGMVESINKLVGTMTEQQRARMDMGEVAKHAMGMLPGAEGGVIDPRDIRGARSARDITKTAIRGPGMFRSLGMAGTMQAMQKSGVDMQHAATVTGLVENMTPEEIRTGKSPMLESFGFSPEEIKEMGQKRLESQLKVGPEGRGVLKEFDKLGNIKEKLQDEDISPERRTKLEEETEKRLTRTGAIIGRRLGRDVSTEEQARALAREQFQLIRGEAAPGSAAADLENKSPEQQKEQVKDYKGRVVGAAEKEGVQQQMQMMGQVKEEMRTMQELWPELRKASDAWLESVQKAEETGGKLDSTVDELNSNLGEFNEALRGAVENLNEIRANQSTSSAATAAAEED